MKEPTMEEVLKLVSFERDDDGRLWIGGREVDFHHLIDAAPDLLEALEWMVWYTDLVHASEVLKKLEDKARAAIAKAKGEG